MPTEELYYGKDTIPSTNTRYDREVMTFYLPVVEAQDPNSTSESINGVVINGTGSSMLRGRSFKYGGSDLKYYTKKLYMNPQSISTSNRKLINKQLTKGGFFIQYWGEELITLQIQGTSGSAGISEINKLLSIYRHEQIHYKDLFLRKNKNFIKTIENTMINISENSTENFETDLLKVLDDTLLGGQGFQTYNSIGTFVDTVQDLYYGTGSLNSNQKSKYGSFDMEATLATLATSLLMEFKGIRYRGYIDNFSFSETANEPGICTYNFNFNVLYSSGKRKNYMPWHIDSEVDGVSVTATIPLLGTENDKYTYPYYEDEISMFAEGVQTQLDLAQSAIDPEFANTQYNRNNLS